MSLFSWHGIIITFDFVFIDNERPTADVLTMEALKRGHGLVV